MKASVIHGRSMDEVHSSSSFRSHTGALLFLSAMFFVNFLVRTILAPLLPVMERELAIGHEEAGSFFLLLSTGVCISLLCSGFFSSRLTHRGTIVLSALAAGVALFFMAFIPSLWGIRLGIFLLGLAAGLYMPSGVATVTGLVKPGDWGKALGIYELAPNMGFVAAPLFSEALLGFFSWRGVLASVGGISLCAGVLFAFFGKGGRFPGEAPRFATIHDLFTETSFWIMIILFSLGIGASLGIYIMLPLYLVSDRGIERSHANLLIALSRFFGAGIAFLAGWCTDRFGPERAIWYNFLLTGSATILMGIAPGVLIIPLVFLQPMLSAGFFPAGYAALSLIGSSPSVRHIVVSFTLPFGLLFGSGVIPAGIGLLGDAGLFSAAIVIVGLFILGGAIMVNYLRLRSDPTTSA